MSTTEAPTFTDADTIPCRGCGDPLILARIWDGKSIPFEPTPSPTGNYRIEEEETLRDGTKVLTGWMSAGYIRSADRAKHGGQLFRQHRCNQPHSVMFLLATAVRESGVELSEDLADAVEKILDGKRPGKVA